MPMKTTGTKHFLPRPAKPRYRQQYGVIVICRSETDQSQLYSRLRQRYPGRELKVVVT